MNPQLSTACQMFLIPISILFVALAVATREELKTWTRGGEARVQACDTRQGFAVGRKEK